VNLPGFEAEYARAMAVLIRTRILVSLPSSRRPGVIGVNGQEYPVPDLAALQAVFRRNSDLAEQKMQQGFTELLLTPIAAPVIYLLERVRSTILEQNESGRVLLSRDRPTDPAIPARVNRSEPIWVWDRVRLALDTPDLVYFPSEYTDHDHRGVTKEEAIRDPRFCAVPGWSIGLAEPMPLMPEQGRGQVVGGRKQLEASSTPREYLAALKLPAYQGETGWTPEDFLTHFLIRLATTNEVSHDRHDGNALWLLGTYAPRLKAMTHLVPVGYWAGQAREKLHLTAHRTGNRLGGWVARTVVRLAG
jgi:hypothetical protein